MKIVFSKSQWEMIGKKAGWVKEAQLVNENGEDDLITRRRTVKVTFDDGDAITTGINGTKKEIE